MEIWDFVIPVEPIVWKLKGVWCGIREIRWGKDRGHSCILFEETIRKEERTTACKLDGPVRSSEGSAQARRQCYKKRRQCRYWKWGTKGAPRYRKLCCEYTPSISWASVFLSGKNKNKNKPNQPKKVGSSSKMPKVTSSSKILNVLASRVTD